MNDHTRPALVIFDCDGVLVDSEPTASRVIAERLTEAGWPMTPQEANDAFMGGSMAIVEAQARDRLSDLPADWRERTYDALFTALADVEKIEGVDAALDALDAAGVPYCIGSNGPHAKMDVTLGGTGLKPRFKGRIFSGVDFPAGKPDPAMFLHAAKHLAAAPSETVVVGDSRNDALAARDAGMRCFGYAAEVPADDFVRLGALPFTDMRILPRLLGLE